MKKNIAILLCIILSVSLVGCQKEAAPKKEITILCCAEYVPETVLKQFEEQYGIAVKVEELLTEAEISETLKVNPGTYDIVIASDYTINELRLLNLLQPMDRSRIKNAANIDPAYGNFYFDPKNEYTIPLNVAAVLVAYNKKTCPVKITSYADLLNPKLKDQIVFLNNSNVLVGIANMYMGLNPISVEKINELPDTLSAFEKNTYALYDDQAQYILAGGEASVGVMFNPQIAEATLQNKDLEIVYPEEGFIMAADAVAFCSLDKPNVSAEKFINFLLDDAINAQIIQNLNGCPTVKGAAAKMDPKYVSAPGNILDASQMEKGEFFCKIAPEIQRNFDTLYVQSFYDHLVALEKYYMEEEAKAAQAKAEAEAAAAAQQEATKQ